jgi:CysZ protein
MKGNPFTGFQYLLRGLKLIQQPKLRLFVLIPLTINCIVFGVLIAASISKFNHWMDSIFSYIPGWLDFIRWIIWPLVLTLMLTVVMYTFSIIANLLASPFNGLLAEKTEELLTGEEVAGYETIGQALLSFPKSIARELIKLLYYLPLAILGLILSVIPMINSIAPAYWFLLGSWMMVIQYCDYPMDNNLRSFKQMKMAIKKQRLTSSGFGAGVMVGTMIPIVNFLIMPVAICGATAYWVDELKAVCPNNDIIAKPPQ